MRVTDRATTRNFLKYMNQAKAAYSKTNQQLASGNRFEKISDDVAAGTRVMRTRMDMYKTEKQLDNVKSVSEEFKSTEDTLLAVGDLLSSAHAIALKAANQEKTSATNDVLANEVKNLREHLLQLANSRFGDKYSFGGSNSGLTQPFTTNDDGKLLYNGIDVNSIKKEDGKFYYMDGTDKKEIPMDEDIYLDVGLGIRMSASQIDNQTGLKINYSGLDAFGFGTEDDTGQTRNLYNILKDLEDNIRTFDKEKLGTADTQLKKLTNSFQSNVADVGSKTKFMENMQERLESNVLNYKTRITGLMGTDEREASMAQSTNDAVLRAVLQMGSKILPVSLMDFIN